MAKVAEPLKSQYRELVELNKRLKNICDVFYIAYDGNIYMHSLVNFIEKFAVIPDDKIPLYRGIMYLPNEFFNFSKSAKISKLSITETQESIYCGQNDNDEITVKLNKVYVPNKEVYESTILEKNIIPKMYNRLHPFISEVDKYDYINIDNTVDIMCDNRVATIINDSAGLYMEISKNIFPSIKSEDKLSYTILPLKDKKNPKKVYVLFKKETEELIIYTICAYLNIHDIYDLAT